MHEPFNCDSMENWKRTWTSNDAIASFPPSQWWLRENPISSKTKAFCLSSFSSILFTLHGWPQIGSVQRTCMFDEVKNVHRNSWKTSLTLIDSIWNVIQSLQENQFVHVFLWAFPAPLNRCKENFSWHQQGNFSETSFSNDSMCQISHLKQSRNWRKKREAKCHTLRYHVSRFMRWVRKFHKSVLRHLNSQRKSRWCFHAINFNIHFRLDDIKCP